MSSEKYTTHERRTCRGNKYNTRRTKLATGFSKLMADRRTQAGTWDDPKTNMLRRLALFGTLDDMARTVQGWRKQITQHHPVDPDYTRKVWVLSDAGRRHLRTLKQKKEVIHE